MILFAIFVVLSGYINRVCKGERMYRRKDRSAGKPVDFTDEAALNGHKEGIKKSRATYTVARLSDYKIFDYNSRTQMLRKLSGSLLSPCACNLIGLGPWAFS